MTKPRIYSPLPTQVPAEKKLNKHASTCIHLPETNPKEQKPPLLEFSKKHNRAKSDNKNKKPKSKRQRQDLTTKMLTSEVFAKKNSAKTKEIRRHREEKKDIGR
jgi:hypothetical protein